jgi:hypothetical protein
MDVGGRALPGASAEQNKINHLSSSYHTPLKVLQLVQIVMA